MQNAKSIFCILVIALTHSAYIRAETVTRQAQTEEKSLTQKEKKTLIQSISKHLKSSYIFKDVAINMGQSIQENMKKGKYDDITEPQEIANVLTKDLQGTSKDLHVRVRVSPKQEEKQKASKEDRLKEEARRQKFNKRNNFGFEEVRILDGNIGYLSLVGFFDAKEGKEIVSAAMTFLSNTDAIIIDLRQNGGGSPEMVQLISSYLFDSTPVHLNSLYWRANDELVEYWTLEEVAGIRNPDADVYVLTSERTFSAAEEFSYNLQNLKRATIIGETTGGGAHPGGPVQVTDLFTVFVPTGRAINPISKTNWEGTGVVPDISTTSDQALDTAQKIAREKLALNEEEKKEAGLYKRNAETQKPQALADVVVNALKSKWVVAIGENHAHVEFHEALRNILSDPKVQSLVNDIVVEFGNSLYQDSVDRYVGGEEVPFDSIKLAWRNTIVSPNTVWDSPVYEQFFKHVRTVNKNRTDGRSYRIVLADTPVDWSKVKTIDDLRPFFDRSGHIAKTTAKEVLDKGRRAILVAGGTHLTLRNMARKNKHGVPYAEVSVSAQLAMEYPGSIFVIRSDGHGRAFGDTRFEKVPRGSVLYTADTEFGSVLVNEISSMRNFDGTPFTAYGTATLADIADAVIYWGMESENHFADAPPETYRDNDYWMSLNVRCKIYGRPPMDSKLREVQGIRNIRE
jgi:C-terminal processing protease CtpA/Prc